MNKYELQNKLKKTSTAYICWIFSVHYLYLNKIGIQFLYWFTFAGLGIWMLVDAFRMGSMVEDYNQPIYRELDNFD